MKPVKQFNNSPLIYNAFNSDCTREKRTHGKGLGILFSILFLLVSFGLEVFYLIQDPYEDTMVVFAVSAIFTLALMVLMIIFFTKNGKTWLDNADLVVFENDKKYVVVKQFSNVKTEEDTKPVFNKVVSEEYDENGNIVYYAEEIFDDEEDLYSDAIVDKFIEKTRHRTFTEIGKEINDSMELLGYQTNVGLPLLASMQASRFINIKHDQNTFLFLRSLLETIGSPYYVIDSKKDSTIAHENALFDAINFAKVNPNKPAIVYIFNLNAKEMMDYLRPIYPYIDNPSGDTYISAYGRSVYLPHNVFFLFSMMDKECLFDINRRLLRHVSLLKFDVQPSNIEKPTKKPVLISLEELQASAKEASENHSLHEDTWKKIDDLVTLIKSVNGYNLQNKIVRRIEDYSIIQLSNGLKDDEALDMTLANNIIFEAILSQTPLAFQEDYNIIRCLDNTFGAEKMPLTRQVIKDYFLLFDKGGNRIHE